MAEGRRNDSASIKRQSHGHAERFPGADAGQQRAQPGSVHADDQRCARPARATRRATAIT
eukprot:1970212-Pyramimonas_sp.AAC.1